MLNKITESACTWTEVEPGLWNASCKEGTYAGDALPPECPGCGGVVERVGLSSVKKNYSFSVDGFCRVTTKVFEERLDFDRAHRVVIEAIDADHALDRLMGLLRVLASEHLTEATDA